MRFILDESAEYLLAVFLRELGHDVTVVARDYPRSLTDRAILSIAHSEGRIVVTNDRDFGELVFHYGLQSAGVILFRIDSNNVETKQSWLARVIEEYPDAMQHFIVITERGARVRPT